MRTRAENPTYAPIGWPGLGALLWIVILSTSSSAQQEHPIGSHGAKVTLSDIWQPKKLSPELDSGQFMSRILGTQFFLIFVEVEAVLDEAAEFRARLKTITDGASLFANEVRHGEFSWRKDGELGIARQRLTGRINDVDVVFEYRLVGRNGLGYLIQMWSAARGGPALASECERVVERLEFPDAESPWSRSIPSHDWSLEIDDHTVTFSISDAEIRQIEAQGDSLATLQSVCHDWLALVLRTEATDADTMLSSVETVLTETWPDLRPLDRSPTTLDGRASYRARFRSDDRDRSFEIVCVPLDEGLFLDIRFVHDGERDRYRSLRDRLISSLRIRSAEPLIAYPEPPPPQETQDPVQDMKLIALLDRSTPLGRTGDTVRAVSKSSDVALLLAGAHGLESYTPTAEVGVVRFTEERPVYGRSLAVLDEITFLADGTGKVLKIVERQEPAVANFSAHVICSAPESGLLLVRPARLGRTRGQDSSSSPSSMALISRDSQGSERHLTTLPYEVPVRLTVDPVTDVALLVTDHLEESGWWHGVQLISLQSGESQRLESWDFVGTVGIAEQGWLVSGRPAAGPRGIYRLDQNAGPELLISGRSVTGISLDERALRFACQIDPDRQPVRGDGSFLYECDLDHVRSLGPSRMPFFARSLSRTCQKTLEQLQTDITAPGLLSTRASIFDFTTSASTISERLQGAPLPTDARQLDELFAVLYGDNDLDDHVHILLSALLSRSLLEGGAEWIDSSMRCSRPIQPFDSWSSSLAIGYVPLEIVSSVLHDPEGWWRPASRIPEVADGRILLLGNDPVRIREQIVQRDVSQLDRRLDQDSAENLREFLAPGDNRTVRRRLYRGLSARGRLETLVELSEPFALAERPAVWDRSAYLAARAGLAGSAAEHEELIPHLFEAIGDDPDHAPFYVILGDLYRGGEREQKERLARSCYEKALSIDDRSSIAEDAREALGELSGSSPR